MGQKVLGIFSLSMVSIIAVCNLRSLSFGALLGKQLVTYYLIAFLFFLLPVGLITASFSTHYPEDGGIYSWIKQAFGSRVGLVAVWLQWLYNVIWYPTQMIFVTSMLFSLFLPSLSSSPISLFLFSVLLFSLFTFINFFGMQLTSLTLNIMAALGTLFPLMLFSTMTLSGDFLDIISINYIQFSSDNLVYLSGVTFGLMGIEICGFHAANVSRPRVTYPFALLLSGSVIMLGMVLASLAIVKYVPNTEVDLLTAMIQVLDNFFQGGCMKEIVGLCIMLGSSATVLSWIMGPSRGIVAAAKDGFAPQYLSIENRYGAPVAILYLQLLIFIILSLAHVLFGVESLYFFLSVITTQLALVVYIMYFLAFFCMRYSLRKTNAFVLPNFMQVILVIVGVAYCIAVMLVGFVLPEQSFGFTSVQYQVSLALGMIAAFVFLWMISGYERDCRK